MPRSLTAATLAAMATPNAAHHLRVFVQDWAATWVDLSSVGGARYVLGARVAMDLASPTTTATITLRTGTGGASIVPLVTSSAPNSGGRLLDVGRGVRVDVAVTAPTATPAAGDWIRVFEGRAELIDQVSADRLTITARNQLARITEVAFPSSITFGTGSTPLETVLQDMLTAGFALAGSPPTLVTPVSPAWAPARAATIAKAGDLVWPAMTKLTDQIGWLIREGWSGNTPQLRLFAPDRTRTTSDWALSGSAPRVISSSALDLQPVRNRITVIARDGGATVTAVASDASSIALYGIRELIISEEASSAVKTLAQCQRMADAILADLRLPAVRWGVQTRNAHPGLEVGDMVLCGVTPQHNDAPQLLAVRAVEHVFENASGSTTVALEGRPASRGRSWLNIGVPGADDGVVPAVVAQIVGSDATTVTVQASTIPAGGVVTYRGGTASLVSGPVSGVESPDGQTWVFSRTAINAGDREARFDGRVNGVTDSDTVTITEQGRDTVPLLTRARVIAIGATSYTVRVSASAPYADRDGTIELVQASGLSITLSGSPRSEGSTDTVTTSQTDGFYGAIGGVAGVAFRDYVVTRPAGDQPARVTWRVSAGGTVPDLDSVDIDPRAVLVPGRIEVVGVVQSVADYTLRYRAWYADGSEVTDAGAVAVSDTQTLTDSAPVVSFRGVTRDTVNGWFVSTIPRTANASVMADLIVGEASAVSTARTVRSQPVPTYALLAGVAGPRFTSREIQVDTGSPNQVRLVFAVANMPAGATYSATLVVNGVLTDYATITSGMVLATGLQSSGGIYTVPFTVTGTLRAKSSDGTVLTQRDVIPTGYFGPA